jgi:hypothetical protein
MKRLLLSIGLSICGGFLLGYIVGGRTSEKDASLAQTPSASMVQPGSGAGQRNVCPIGKIHPGMMLEDVRSELGGYVMDYRGSRMDQDAYFVDAGACHAFLDFNSGDRRLDSIDYGLGIDKIELRSKAPSGGPPSESAGNTNGTSPPPASSSSENPMGYPVPEDIFVEAYVRANIGSDNLDKEQLKQLAQDEYRMGRSIETQTLLVGGDVIDTRGRRAMKYLENRRGQDPPGR